MHNEKHDFWELLNTLSVFANELFICTVKINGHWNFFFPKIFLIAFKSNHVQYIYFSFMTTLARKYNTVIYSPNLFWRKWKMIEECFYPYNEHQWSPKQHWTPLAFISKERKKKERKKRKKERRKKKERKKERKKEKKEERKKERKKRRKKERRRKKEKKERKERKRKKERKKERKKI